MLAGLLTSHTLRSKSRVAFASLAGPADSREDGTILPSQWIDDNGLTVKATLLNIHWDQYPRLGGPTATGVLGYSVNLQYSNGLSYHLDEFVTITYP